MPMVCLGNGLHKVIVKINVKFSMKVLHITKFHYIARSLRTDLSTPEMILPD